MGLQEQIAEAIIAAFDELGGNVHPAAEAAMRAGSVEAWVQQETAKIAVAGGAEMIIPGLHALTIPAGITYLMHKMAYISRGIGALKGAYVIETAHYSDLRNILILWANGEYYNAHLLDYLSVSVDIFAHVLSDDGYATLTAASAKAAENNIDNVVMNTLHVMHTMANEFNGDEQALRMIATLTDDERAMAVAEAAQKRMPIDPAVQVSRPMTQRMGTRLATRMATRFASRIPAQFLVGFIPVAGAVVNAFFNAQTLMSMAEMAEKYYDHQFRIKDLEAL
ncbi:MAG: hypothetical protein ACPG7F_18775 [Aggregatilineales bacterium]